MQNAELWFDPVKTIQDILDTLKHAASPFGKLGDLPHFLLSIATALLCLLVMILLIPCVIKLGLWSFLQLGSKTHMLPLKHHLPYMDVGQDSQRQVSVLETSGNLRQGPHDGM